MSGVLDATAAGILGTLTGDVVGDVVGDTAGTHTGPVIGDVTGDVVGDTAGTHTGPVIGLADVAKTLDNPSLFGANINDLVDVSTQFQAETGTNNDTAMTPLRTAQAITAQSPQQVFMTTIISDVGTILRHRGATFTVNLSSTGNYIITWTTPQPDNEYSISICPFGVIAGGQAVGSIAALNAANFTYQTHRGNVLANQAIVMSAVRV